MKKGSHHSDMTRLKIVTNRHLKTHCKRGHEFTPENTRVSSSGNRACFKCATLTMAKWRRKTLYGCSPEQYEKSYQEQKGLCVLPSCGQPIGATDHCHVTGIFRGLMCRSHNLAIGLFSDKPILLREAADYLETFNG